MTAGYGQWRNGTAPPDLTWPADSATLRDGMTHLYVLKPKPTRPCLEAWV